jgi:hypothetical protein
MGVRLTAPIQTDYGAHPGPYTKDIATFPEVKWLGCDVYHPPSSNAEVKQTVKLYLEPFLSLHGLLYGKI